MSFATSALVFAKHPQPGLVKTRLVGPLSPEQAAAFHLASLRTVCELVSMQKELSLVLVVTPDDQVDSTRSLLADVVLEAWPQGPGDLGSRLDRATRRAFSAGMERLILLGADSPTLPPEFLARAVALLDDSDGVLGSCADGGYYLLGLRRHLGTLFTKIEWGGATVADDTRERAADAGVTLAELPEWYDVDRVEDLARAADDLGRVDLSARPAAAELKNWLDDVLEPLGHAKPDRARPDHADR